MKPFMTSLLALAFMPMASAAGSGAHWAYDGNEGPDHWAEIDHQYASCQGVEQSPIDLNGWAVPAKLHAPAVYWSGAEVTDAQNNGHTFQVALENAGNIVVDNVSYKFLQFHFHSGSEHTINGKRYPLEVHLVHAAEDGRLAVIGVMFEEGSESRLLNKLIGVMPGQAGDHVDPAMTVNLNDFLPGDWSTYRYQGSLTTPPCSEVVAWTVFEKPLQASPDQLKVFDVLFHHSYRPVQELGRRFVLKTN
jgi:carbonic anhydrase